MFCVIAAAIGGSSLMGLIADARGISPLCPDEESGLRCEMTAGMGLCFVVFRMWVS